MIAAAVPVSFWWWLTYGVPTLQEARIELHRLEDQDDTDEWCAMREQAWAIREDLAE